MLLALAGCVTYEPAPVYPIEVLADLRAVSLDAVRPPTRPPGAASEEDRPLPFDPRDGLTVEEAAAVAVSLNPGLRASRAEMGVAEAQLIEAGLLPDPSLAWEAGWNPPEAWNLGVGELHIVLPLLRPGERDATIGEAQARIDEVHWAALGDEWQLARDVHLAFLDLLAVGELRRLNEQLQQVASRTHDFFLRARELGAATALQETTAAIQAGEVRLEGERLVMQERRARQALNALLGIPPQTEYALQTPHDPFTLSSAEPRDAEILTERAMDRRPDLRELLAAYDRAEQRLRLAVARQWPDWAVGTSLEIGLPFFSRFNRPAIRAAWMERERLRRQVDAAVHGLRAEVHDAVTALDLAHRQVEFFTTVIEPRLADSLRLAEEAFRARQVTAGEILVAQSQVLDARVRLLEARIVHARALATLTWVTADDTMGGDP